MLGRRRKSWRSVAGWGQIRDWGMGAWGSVGRIGWDEDLAKALKKCEREQLDEAGKPWQ